MPRSNLIWPLLRLLGALPLRALFATTRFGTRLARRRGSKTEAITRVNLALCYPYMESKEREELIAKSLWHDGLTIAEFAPFYTWKQDKLLAVVDTPDQGVLQAALADGRGALLCAPHFGAWELLGQVLSHEHELHALYKPSKRQSVDDVLLPGRSRFGVVLHATNAAGVRGLHKALASNGLACILPDQEPEMSGGEFAPFFGQPALTMTLLGRLARKRRVPVLLTAAVRDTAHCRYRIIHRRLDEGIYSSDTATSLRVLNAAIESLVNEHPEQYLWSYRRFETLPSGERRDYGRMPKEE